MTKLRSPARYRWTTAPAALGCDLDVTYWITGSWSRGNVLGHRALGCRLAVTYWIT